MLAPQARAQYSPDQSLMELDGSIHEPLALDGDPPVRGFLHRAADGADAIVLTHGAGSNANAPLLRALARAFAADGITVLRCDLPFRQARASGPPSPAGAERDRQGPAPAPAPPAPRGAGRCLRRGDSHGGRAAALLPARPP